MNNDSAITFTSLNEWQRNFLKSLSVNSLKKLNNLAVISTFISETALLLWSDLTKFVCHATGSGQVTG